MMGDDTHARAVFLATLRATLRDIPQADVDDILADYAAHFDEGAAQGRNEHAIATSLGDPLALADELRVSLRIDDWQSKRSIASGARLIASALAIGLFKGVLGFVAAALVAPLCLVFAISILALAIAGVWLLLAGATLGLPGGVLAAVLAGVGAIAAALSLAALLALAARTLLDAAARFARLQLRLSPMGKPQGALS